MVTPSALLTTTDVLARIGVSSRSPSYPRPQQFVLPDGFRIDGQYVAEINALDYHRARMRCRNFPGLGPAHTCLVGQSSKTPRVAKQLVAGSLDGSYSVCNRCLVELRGCTVARDIQGMTYFN